MKWKQKRRPPLQREEVAKMIRSLNMLGWVNLKASRNLPVSEKAVVGF
jgi:hypothetical protein